MAGRTGNNYKIAAKDTIQFGKLPKSLTEKLQTVTKANEVIAYIVAANLKFHDKSGRNLPDEASYGDIHNQRIVIDTSGSKALMGLKDLLDFLYGKYNNSLKQIQPNLSFRRLTQAEKEKRIIFDLGLEQPPDLPRYRVMSFDGKRYPQVLRNASTVSIFAAARLKDPVSQKVGGILGKTGQTVMVGGPGVGSDNVMVNTAETAKKLGSSVGFITAEYIFNRQKSLQIKPNFILVARTIYERACLMHEIGRLIVVLPGGVAVVEEVLTAIACNLRYKLQKRRLKPILLWNQNRHWDKLYSWLKVLGLANEVRLISTERQLYKYLA